MDWLIYIALWVGTTLLYLWLRPKPEHPDPGIFRPPKPREGEAIPVIFGTTVVGPSITWFGDVSAKEVSKEVTQLWGIIRQDVPAGHDYYCGMMLTLCHGPVDQLIDIFIGEKRLSRTEQFISEEQEEEPKKWPDLTKPVLPIDYPADGNVTRVSVNAPDLMGGIEQSGGVVGQFDMHWGSNVQGPNDYLAAFWGADILPQYRLLTYAVLRRMNMGKSPSPPPWRFVMRRCPDVLGQTALSVITDEDGNEVANAAECIYEILTDTVWGLGRNPNDIDLASFQAVGATLYSEGLGYSGQLASTGEAYTAIGEILRHVEGLIYQDPTSGLITIKLIRNDYTVGNLVSLDETNSVIDSFTRGSWGEAVNETKVKFIDIHRRFTDAAAQAQNLAAIQAMDGEIISREVTLKGLGTHQQAQTAAERLNRTTSVPLNRFRLRTNRVTYGFHPGKPFKITSSEYGVTAMVCRVASIDYGSLVEGEVRIEAVQDAWDLSTRAYASPDDLVDLEPCGPLALIVAGYDPADDPGAVYSTHPYVKLFEAPYWHNTTGGRAWACVSRTTNHDNYWECWRAIHGAEREKMVGAKDFVAVGLLEDELPQKGVPMKSITFVVESAGNLEDLTNVTFAGMLAGERLCIVDNEILCWQYIANLGGNRYLIGGVWRGQLDTVPDYHVPSSPVFFYYNATGANSALDLTDPDDLDDFTNVQMWPVIVDIDGTSEEVDRAEMHTALVGQRASAPYPPGNVQLDGAGYETWPATTSGDVVLSWSHRSRTGQSQMVAQDDSIGFTLVGTLTIEVLIDGVSVRSWTGVTGTSQTYTFAQRSSDDADLSKRVEFRITPIGASSEVGTVRRTPSFVMGA